MLCPCALCYFFYLTTFSKLYRAPISYQKYLTLIKSVRSISETANTFDYICILFE